MKKIYTILTVSITILLLFMINAKANTYNTTIQIDSPTTTIKQEQMQIRGWVMSNLKDREIKVYIDNEEVPDVQIVEREDVLKAITGYGGRETNEKPGFETIFNSTILTIGNHKVTISVLDKYTKEVVATRTSNFIIKEYDAEIKIEKPDTFIKGLNTTISGYYLSNSKYKQLEVYIDNQKIENQINYISRNDLTNITKKYGEIINKEPGFNINYDLTKLKDGNHEVKVLIRDTKTNEIIKKATKNFELKKVYAKMNLENPQTSNVSKNIYVEGWEMSESPDSEVKIVIDRTEMPVNINRKTRDDVIRNITGYGDITNNPTPGFVGNIDVSRVTPGRHMLHVKVYSKYGDLIESRSKEMYIYSNVSFGIDVSKHQGRIEWSSVKKDGISFAFIRAGNRGYGTGLVVEDPTFEYNVVNAHNNNIKIGTYFFSQAINEREAEEEAQRVINMITLNPNILGKVTLPIAFDTEYSHEVHDGRADYLSKNDRTKVARAFINYLRDRGYSTMIYASKSFLYNNLDMNSLSDVDVWLAHYTTTTNPMEHPSDYTGIYKVWQYTSKGRVSGIQGNVDLDVSYENY